MNYWRKSRQCLIALLFTGLLLLLSLSASATELKFSEVKMYTITEYQLTELESKLSRLAINNETLATDCNELKVRLAASQAALEKAKKESEQLKMRLAELTLQSKSSETLLQTANELLQKSAAEQKRTQARIKRQRTIAWCLAGVAILYAAKK